MGRWTGTVGRRWRTVAALGAAVAVVGSLGAWPDRGNATVPLDAATVAVSASGSRVTIGVKDVGSLVDGTRAVDPTTAAAQQRWLAAGRVPGAGTRWEPMVRTALLDLHVLTLDDGAAVAGWSPIWRYVWPRDASFTAVALARTGHIDDAVAILAFLQRVQPADGVFQARYRPDGSGPPDDRGVEVDGTGWVLWAADQVAAAAPDDASRRAVLARIDPLVRRSTDAAIRLSAEQDGLPRPSLDYWETRERAVTLGTAAPLLAGLQAATRLAAARGDSAAAGRAADAGRTLAQRITGRFGAAGYPRTVDGGALDAAVTFLMPPILDAALPGVPAAWRQAQTELARPSGGLAPGSHWKDDGISWTPETALFALTAAGSGDRATAKRWLDWLLAHRTDAGSLPEKVLADGSPAAVAPLAWSAACVVLAVDELDRHPGSPLVTAP